MDFHLHKKNPLTFARSREYSRIRPNSLIRSAKLLFSSFCCFCWSLSGRLAFIGYECAEDQMPCGVNKLAHQFSDSAKNLVWKSKAKKSC